MYFRHTLQRPFAVATLVVFSCLYLQPVLAAAATFHPPVKSGVKQQTSGERNNLEALKHKLSVTPAAPSFLENKGQAPARYEFYYQSQGRSVFFAKDRVYYMDVFPNKDGKSQRIVYEQRLNGSVAPVGERPLVKTHSEFIGKNQFTEIKSYERVVYKNLYSGIDLAYFFTADTHTLKYEYVVQPQADASVIKSTFSGVKSVTLDQAGNLLLNASGKNITHKAPYVYQTNAAGEKTTVAASYMIIDPKKKDVGFTLGAYDASLPLVIDPLLNELGAVTYLGGSDNDDYAQDIVLDAAGNVYVAGETQSATFPFTSGYDSDLGGTTRAYVKKYNHNLSAVLAEAIISGSTMDYARAVTLDGSGNVIITGIAGSSDFPVTTGRTFGGGVDIFVSKFNAALTALSASTLMGGASNDEGNSVAFRSDNNTVILVGSAGTGYATTGGSAQPSFAGGLHDMVVTIFDNTDLSILYSTYLGGTGSDRAFGAYVGDTGNVYVAGYTTSEHVTGVDPGISCPNATCGYAAMLSPTLSTATAMFVNGTESTGYGDDLFSIAVDGSGNVFAVGSARNRGMPNRVNDKMADGKTDALVVKFNSAMSSILATRYIGGDNDDDVGRHLVVQDGVVYVGGDTSSAGEGFYTTTDAFQSSNAGGYDMFVAEVSSDLETLNAASLAGGSANDYLWGIAVSTSSQVYFAGYTDAAGFPMDPSNHPPGVDKTYNGYDDGVIGRLDNITNISPAVSILYPDNAETYNNSHPTFLFSVTDANSDLRAFRIEISTDDLFTTGRIIAYTGVLDSYSGQEFIVGQSAGGGAYDSGLNATTLSTGIYFWRVRAVDEHGAVSDYSDARSIGIDVPAGDTCGDNYCTGTESYDSCPADCIGTPSTPGDLLTTYNAGSPWHYVPGYGTSDRLGSRFWFQERLQLVTDLAPGTDRSEVEFPNNTVIAITDTTGTYTMMDPTQMVLAAEADIPPTAPAGTAKVFKAGFDNAKITVTAGNPIVVTLPFGSANASKAYEIYQKSVDSEVWTKIKSLNLDANGKAVFTTLHLSEFAGGEEGVIPEFSTWLLLVTVATGFGLIIKLRPQVSSVR